jgi:hypothetical protein
VIPKHIASPGCCDTAVAPAADVNAAVAEKKPTRAYLCRKPLEVSVGLSCGFGSISDITNVIIK